MDNKSLLDFIQDWCVDTVGSFYCFFDKISLYIEKYSKAMKMNRNLEKLITLITFFGSMCCLILYAIFKYKAIIDSSSILFTLFLTHVFLLSMSKSLHSVSRSVFILLVLNFCAALYIFIMISELIKPQKVLWIFIIIIFSILWCMFSLIADSRIAKLSNEIITGIFTFLFTLTSFILTLLTEGIITEKIKTIDNQSEKLIADLIIYLLNRDNGLIKSILKVLCFLLLIIGLSSVQIVITSIRVHWEEKYRDKVIEQ